MLEGAYTAIAGVACMREMHRDSSQLTLFLLAFVGISAYTGGNWQSLKIDRHHSYLCFTKPKIL